MNDIIIYGVRGVRKIIEYTMSNLFNIIGYSDSDYIYENISEYEYKPFYPPYILNKQSFDYIVISVSDKTLSAQIVNTLLLLGITQNKIIETCYIINSVYLFDIPLKSYTKLNQNFDGLCLGMSYSYNTFLTHYFSKRFYKLSYFGADIYFHYKNILCLADNHIDLLSNIKYIVFDLPYYAFNWDLSKAKHTIRSRFSLLEPFNDYHNYGKTSLEKWYIEEYMILKKMFSNKLSINTSSFSNNFETRNIVDFPDINDHFYTLEHVWTSIHEDTIIENINLFDKMLTLLYSINPQIRFSIVIYPMYLEYLKNDISTITKMKDSFYHTIDYYKSKFNIAVYDCFDKFQNKSLYFDVHHLNGIGGYQISNYLNLLFTDSLYE